MRQSSAPRANSCKKFISKGFQEEIVHGQATLTFTNTHSIHCVSTSRDRPLDYSSFKTLKWPTLSNRGLRLSRLRRQVGVSPCVFFWRLPRAHAQQVEVTGYVDVVETLRTQPHVSACCAEADALKTAHKLFQDYPDVQRVTVSVGSAAGLPSARVLLREHSFGGTFGTGQL